MPLVARTIPRINTCNPPQQEPTSTNLALRAKGPLAAAAATAMDLMNNSPPTSTQQQQQSSARTNGRNNTPPPQTPQTPPQQQQQQQQEPDRKLTCPSPPPIIKDKRSEATYARKGLLGEGGFARCYEIEDHEGKRYAAKVVPKTTLKLQKNKNKLFAEIKIHQSMRHNNIVKFHFCFEDNANVYMVLELCESKTMMDMLKRRKRFTEPEVRYYMLQILDACRYMHGNRIIHRDLKLGNLFLTAGMEVRIGDFGLAAIIRHDGDRKKTICGTPNYIAPEILFDTQNGHSYEVDVWSLGVIMYTLLVGRPPFQTKDVKAIYRRIKENNYEFPSQIALSPQAKSLIQALLSTRPETRPSVANIIDHPFFRSGLTPSKIPPTALHTEPKFTFPSPIPSLSTLPVPPAPSATALNGRVRRPLTEMGVPPPAVSPATNNQYQTRYQRQQQQQMQQPQSQLPSSQPQSQNEHLHHQFHPHQQQHVIRRKPSEEIRNNGSDSSKDMKEVQQRRQIEADVNNLEIPHNPSPIIYTTLQPASVPATRHRFVSSVRGATSSPTGNPRQAASANDGTRSPVSRSTIGPLGPTMSGPSTGTAPVPARHPLASSTTCQPLSSTIGVGGVSSNRTGENGFGDRDGMEFRPNFAASTASAVGAPMQVRNNLLGTTSGSRNSHGENGTGGSSSSTSPTSPHPPVGTAKAGSLGVLEAMLRNLTVGFDECRDRGEGGGSMLDCEAERFSGEEYHAPKIFICKWIDYSNKYGLGYQLTDGSVGVYFNDSTSIILSPDDHHFEYLYYARDGDRTLMHRRAYVLTDFPNELTKKVTLLKHFRGYMTENLFKASTYTFTDRSNTSDLDFLTKYLRTKHAVVFRLSNRVVQINFFDHTKVVLAHDAELVTYINRNREIFTSTLARVLAGGGEAVSRIRYAKDVLEQLILKRAKKAARDSGSRKSSSMELGKRGEGT